MKHEKLKDFSVKRSKNNLRLNYANVKKAFMICSALDHKLHQRIISFFEEEEIFSEEKIANKIRLELDVTQGHLRVMVRAGVLNVFHQGTEKCYSVNVERLEAIRKFYTVLNA